MTEKAKKREFVYEVISSEDEGDGASKYRAKASNFPYAANVHKAARNNYFKICHGDPVMPVRSHSNIALQEAQALAELDDLLSDSDMQNSMSSDSC